MLHGSETWPVREEKEVALQQAEMKMVKWMWMLISMNEITPSPVTTEMGDCLWVDKPPCFVTSHSSQLSLLPSVGWKMSTDQCDDALQLVRGVKAGTVHSSCG